MVNTCKPFSNICILSFSNKKLHYNRAGQQFFNAPCKRLTSSPPNYLYSENPRYTSWQQRTCVMNHWKEITLYKQSCSPLYDCLFRLHSTLYQRGNFCALFRVCGVVSRQWHILAFKCSIESGLSALHFSLLVPHRK